MRNLLSLVPNQAQDAVAAIVRTIFAQPDHASAMDQLHEVARMLSPKFPQHKPRFAHAVRVHVPGWQQVKIKKAGEFERVDRIKGCRVFEEELAADPSGWIVSFGMPMAKRLDAAGCLTDAGALWSMWPGYLKEDKQKKLLSFLEERSIPLTIEHTSGHASIPTCVDRVPPAGIEPAHAV